jgi:hypothetical protein
MTWQDWLDTLRDVVVIVGTVVGVYRACQIEKNTRKRDR